MHKPMQDTLQQPLQPSLQFQMQFPMLLDGGLSNQLESQAIDLSNPLWTASAIINAPEKIVAAHRAYLDAGADCIITASYQASIAGFMKIGYSQADASDLMQQTVTLAQQAIAEYAHDTNDEKTRTVAASIGPYGASLADGSEYRGNYGVSKQTLIAYHQDRLALLAAMEPDFFACETIPCLEEALVLAELVSQYDIPAWLSFSCKDAENLCDGSTLAAACEALNAENAFFALGVNCSAPQHISPLIDAIKQTSPEKRIIIYPNSGEVYNATTKTWQPCESPLDFATQAQQWLDQGVDIIGGCCRIGPAHIKEISRYLHITQ